MIVRENKLKTAENMGERVFSVKPVAKPRMTRRDKWAKRDCVVRYREYRDMLRLLGRGFELGDEVRIVFGMPFARSYGKAKRDGLRGRAHQIRPDVDNLLKGIMDAFRESDSSIWRVEVKKIWTDGEGFITIENLDSSEETLK